MSARPRSGSPHDDLHRTSTYVMSVCFTAWIERGRGLETRAPLRTSYNYTQILRRNVGKPFELMRVTCATRGALSVLGSLVTSRPTPREGTSGKTRRIPWS